MTESFYQLLIKLTGIVDIVVFLTINYERNKAIFLSTN